MNPPTNLPDVPAAAGPPRLPPELRPNIDDLVIEDDEPVESFFAEKQMRLLAEPLYRSWGGPGEGRSFEVFTNVGLFRAVKEPPLVPDVMLSVDVRIAQDLSRKENRTYLMWEFGKPPDVVIEFVFDRRGGEEGYKLKQYARCGVPYYVIFDPQNRLKKGVLRCFELRPGTYQLMERAWFPLIGLGLTLWEGPYEKCHDRWLRWCDSRGEVIPCGAERIQQESRRADEAGRRADEADRRADEAGRRADEERQRRERLESQLRALGVEPEP